jgi:hypothetical protein
VALEPWYSLEVAAELIPVSLNNLNVILHRHAADFPPRYLTAVEGDVQTQRILTESECLRIRNMVIGPTRKTTQHREFKRNCFNGIQVEVIGR